MTALGGSEVFKLFGSIEVGRQKFAGDMAAMEKRVGGFSAAVQSGFAKAQGFIERHGAAIKQTGIKITAAGAMMTAAIVKTVGAAASFEQEMRNVNVIMRESEEGFAAISARVLDLSTKLPQSATVLAKGLYNIGSSGFKGAEGLHVLEQAARAAVAGATETDVAAKGLTTVLNAYGLQASEAGRVSDVLFKTVERGVLTFPELAENLGQVISSAAAAGVPFEHVAAAFATMTKGGISAAEASTALNRIILTFLKPSEEFAKAVKKITGEEASAIIQTKGLGGAVEVLNQIAGENPAILANVGLEMRALKAAMSLARGEGKVFSADMEAMANAVGATVEAFEEQSKSFAVQWDLMKSSLMAAAITVGNALLPRLRPLVDLVAKIGTKVAQWAKEHPALTTALTTAAVAVAGLMVALGPLLIALPGLVIAIGFIGTALAALSTVVIPAVIVGVIALATAITSKLLGAHHAQAEATKKATEAYREHTKEMLTLAQRTEELATKKERTKEETDELIGAMKRLKDEYPELLRFYHGDAKEMLLLADRVETLGAKKKRTKEETDELNEATKRLKEEYPELLAFYRDESVATKHLTGLLKLLRLERIKTLSSEEAGERRRAAWLGRRITFLTDWIDLQNAELATQKTRMSTLIKEGKDVSDLSLEYNLLKRSVETVTTELEKLQKELGPVSDGMADVDDATIKTGDTTAETGDKALEASEAFLALLKAQLEVAEAMGDTTRIAALQATYMNALGRVWEKYRGSLSTARLEHALAAKKELQALKDESEQARQAEKDFDGLLATLNALVEVGYDPVLDALLRLNPEFEKHLRLAQETCDTYNALAKTALPAFQKGLEKAFAAFEKFRDIGIEIITGVKPGIDTVKALTEELRDLQFKLMFDVLTEEDRARIEARVEAIRTIFADLADDVKEMPKEVSPLWLDLARTIQEGWGNAFVQMRREGGRLLNYLNTIWQNVLDVFARFVGKMVAEWLFGIEQMVKTGKLGGVFAGPTEAPPGAPGAVSGKETPAWVGTLLQVGVRFLQASAVFAAAAGDWRGALLQFVASVLIQKILSAIRTKTTAVEAASTKTMAGVAALISKAAGAMLLAAEDMAKAAAAMLLAAQEQTKAGALSFLAGVVPFFAQEGGIFTKPTLTVLSEKEPEVVLPLSHLVAPNLMGAVGGPQFALAGEPVGITIEHMDLSVDSLDELSLRRLARRMMHVLGDEVGRLGPRMRR